MFNRDIDGISGFGVFIIGLILLLISYFLFTSKSWTSDTLSFFGFVCLFIVVYMLINLYIQWDKRRIVEKAKEINRSSKL